MIRPMTEEERRRAKERETINTLRRCVSCGNPSSKDFCSFCINEE